MKTRIVTCLLLLLAICSYAQQSGGAKANFHSTSSSMKIVPSLNSKKSLKPAKKFKGEVKDGRSSRGKIIIGKGSSNDDPLAKKPNRLSKKIQGKAPDLVFDAVTDLGSSPTDPSLAVGPNHVFAVFNTGFIIYDKEGNDLTGALDVENIFDAGGCCDLTASYDNLADRWVISYLFFDGSVQVAVSRGRNPVTSDWSVYTYQGLSDYQKLSVWSDGYYLTGNNDGTLYIVERDAMLASERSAEVVGLPLPGLATGGFFSPQVLNVSSKDYPARGNTPVVFLQDDAYEGIAEDHLKIWTVNVDFENPTNSTISQPVELLTTEFINVFDEGDFANLPQPNGGGAIDALQAIIMNQAQFRKFDTHNSALFTFVVDIDGSEDGKLAGIRWYELRQTTDGEPWTIYQEGTYTSPDGKHAWNGTMMMDDLGNIAMGYTAMGGTTNTFASSYYTGRFANDPLNTMTVSETLIAAGQGNFPNERYGDYNKIDIDPNTDRQFWFINEYVGENDADGNRSNVVGVFQMAPDRMVDAGIIDIDIPERAIFTTDQEVKITIFNYGANPISNFEVSYRIGNGTPVTETFTGTIASNENADFTFTELADFTTPGTTYTVTTTVQITDDEFAGNDEKQATIIHPLANDLGIVDIIAPADFADNMEPQNITVEIYNFGGEEKTDFEVSYSINDGASVTETVPGPIPPLSSLQYTFDETLDISALGTYNISVSTQLANDVNQDNDQMDKTITSVEVFCKTYTNEDSIDIEDATDEENGGAESTITVEDDFTIFDVNATVTLSHEFFSDIVIGLVTPTEGGQSISSLFFDDIDSNATSFIDTNFDDAADIEITDGAEPFTGSFRPLSPLSVFNGLSSKNDWSLTVIDFAPENVGQIQEWSLELCGFNNPTLAIEENLVTDSELVVIEKEEDQFEIRLETKEVQEQLAMEIYSITGRRLLYQRLQKENNTYLYDLDMSYASSGVYLVKISNRENAGMVKKFVVK